MTGTSSAAYLKNRARIECRKPSRLTRSPYAMAVANRLIILLAACSCISVEAHTRKLTYNVSDLSSVALFIARERLSQLTTTLVVAEQHSTLDPTDVNELILENLLQHLDDRVAVQLYFGDDKLQLWEHYVFIVDTVLAFRALQWRFPQNFFERHFNFFIVLTHPTPNLLRVLRRIFIICYMFHVINATILVDDPQLGVCLYTYKLFTEWKCQVVQPVLQYRFSQGFDSLRTVFDKKLKNLYRCPLRVLLRVIPPQVIFSEEFSSADPLHRWKGVSGIEGELLKLIAETMNFQIKVMPFLEDNYSPNYFAELKSGKADLSVGSFSASDPHRWSTSQTVQYHQSPYVFAVRAGHVLESFARLARPFRANVWGLLGLLLFSGCAIICVLLHMKPAIRRFVLGNQNYIPMTNFFGVFLGYPVSRVPRRNFARFLLGLWLLFTLVLRNAYQCGLYDAIRLDKFTRLPKSYDDLIKWNYSILLSRDIIELNLFPDNSSTVLIEGSFMNRIQALQERPGPVATVLLLNSYFYQKNTAYDIDIHVQVIPEVIYMYQMVMYFPKHSIFVSAFNKKLQSLSSSGITQAISSRFYSRPGLMRAAPENAEPRALGNKRLQAAYKMVGWGLLAATLVFVVELTSRYSARARRVADWIQ